jgi:hypothetical protein
MKASNFDFSKVTFSDVKKLGKGKMVYVNMNSDKIILQTPKMNIPFGISRWREPNADDNKGDSFRLGLSFYGEENNNDIREFKKNLSQFDDMIVQKIKENSKEWLNKPNVSMEVIQDAYYVPNIKSSVDKEGKEYPSRLEIKLDRQRDGEEFTGRFVSNKKFNHDILIFDENKNLIDLNESNYDSVIPKGCHAICIIELVYVSITAKISCKWKLVQAKVFKNKRAITDYAIIDEEDEEDENDDKLKDDLDSENDNDNETSEVVDDEVNELADELQEAQLEEEPDVINEKPTKRGRKKN